MISRINFIPSTEQIKSAANSPPNARKPQQPLPASNFSRSGKTLILKRKEVKRMLQVKDVEKKIIVAAVDEARTTYVVPT